MTKSRSWRLRSLSDRMDIDIDIGDGNVTATSSPSPPNNSIPLPGRHLTSADAMGFTTGLLGGFTLTATILYLGTSLHARNRAHQSALLRQQAYLINNVVDPQPPPPPPTNRQVQAGLWETAKDKWNAELEKNVKALQTYDWRAASERLEESIGAMVNKAFAKGKAAANEVAK